MPVDHRSEHSGPGTAESLSAPTRCQLSGASSPQLLCKFDNGGEFVRFDVLLFEASILTFFCLRGSMLYSTTARDLLTSALRVFKHSCEKTSLHSAARLHLSLRPSSVRFSVSSAVRAFRGSVIFSIGMPPLSTKRPRRPCMTMMKNWTRKRAR